MGACLSQPDGARVSLPCEEVFSIGHSGKSFAIKEFGEKLSASEQPRLVVVSTKLLAVSKYWACDITGTLSTLSGTAEDGSTFTQRVLVASPENILVYCDQRGQPFLFPPAKNLGLTWQNKCSLADLSTTQAIGAASLTSTSDDSTLPPMPDAITESTTAPVYCATIADARALYDSANRVKVELQCRSLRNLESNHFILQEDSSTDELDVYCTKTVQPTDRVNKIMVVVQKDANNKYWLEVDCGPNWQPENEVGSLQTVASGTIAWAKTFPDWTALPLDGRPYSLENKKVTWIDTASAFYIEEQDGSNGILVNAELGDTMPCSISLAGEMNTNGNGERVINAAADFTFGGLLPKPHGMNNRDLGGADFNIYSPGKISGVGVNTFGMLVRTWGKVTAARSDQGFFYIDDGSHIADGSSDNNTNVPYTGVRVAFSGSTYPSVGDYVIVTGPCGRMLDYSTYNNVMCIKTHDQNDLGMYPPRIAPANLQAAGCFAKVVLSWDKLYVEKYRVYRSSTETGIYSSVGDTASTDYTDTAVSNGVTYWYKVTAINGGAVGPYSTAVQAIPMADAPIVNINNLSIDGNGLAHIECSGSSTQGDPIYDLVVDDEPVWTFEQSEIGNIYYDTTQLSNGTHKIQLKAIAGSYGGVTTQTVNVQNYISQFQVPDDMSGYQPISATFSGPTNWTLTCQQGSTVLYTTNGTGTLMNVAWDAGSTWGDFDVVLTANSTLDSGAMAVQSSSSQSKTVKSRKDQGRNPRSPFVWSSIYVADKDSDYANAFSYAHSQAVDALFWKLGYTVVPYGRISLDHEWQDVVIDSILTGLELPADIFVFSGHGLVGANGPTQILWQGGMSGKFPNSSFNQGSGLTAFKSLTALLRGQGKYEPVGPAINNFLNWDLTTGRYSGWQVNRRLKFVMLNECEGGKGLMSMAFGIPRGRYPGLGRAFLSFKNAVGCLPLRIFSERFWREWQKPGVNLAQAAWRAKCSSYGVPDYVIHGDPNLVIF